MNHAENCRIHRMDGNCNCGAMSEQELEDLMQNETNEADQIRLAPAPSSLAEMERIHILATMDWAAGNKARAARQLGVTIKTLYTRLHEYGYANIRHVERRTHGAS